MEKELGPGETHRCEFCGRELVITSRGLTPGHQSSGLRSRIPCPGSNLCVAKDDKSDKSLQERN